MCACEENLGASASWLRLGAGVGGGLVGPHVADPPLLNRGQELLPEGAELALILTGETRRIGQDRGRQL